MDLGSDFGHRHHGCLLRPRNHSNQALLPPTRVSVVQQRRNRYWKPSLRWRKRGRRRSDPPDAGDRHQPPCHFRKRRLPPRDFVSSFPPPALRGIAAVAAVVSVVGDDDDDDDEGFRNDQESTRREREEREFKTPDVSLEPSRLE